ncbi:hypothetical protein [Microbulbifer sediminum]|uniref:hypothetical protein n=1 Tax=Microbulbifer sediminum TaxID=2904250 RepID=UPI001F16DEEB|nr:hypothetical protein [Microbulbifer sediminum]
MHSSKIIKNVSAIEIAFGITLMAIAAWLALNGVLEPNRQDPHSVGRIIGWVSLFASISLLVPGVALRISVKAGLVLQALIPIYAIFILWLGAL